MQRSDGRRVEIFLRESLGKYLPSTAVQLALKAKSLRLKSVFVRTEISSYWKGSFGHILREDMSSDGKAHFDKPWQKSKEFWLVTARNLWHLWNNCTLAFWSLVPILARVLLYPLWFWISDQFFRSLIYKTIPEKRYHIRWLLFPFQKQGQSTHHYTAHF